MEGECQVANIEKEGNTMALLKAAALRHLNARDSSYVTLTESAVSEAGNGD